MSAAHRLQHDLIDQLQFLQAVSGQRESVRGFRGAARVLPENGSTALRADHGVRRILQHQNRVRHSDRERAAGTAFTDDRRDDRNRDMRELNEIPADRLRLPVLLSVNAGVSARGINKRDDRETELLGKLHQAKGLPVPFGVCHAEVAVRTALDVAALLMPDHHHGVAAETRETADNRRIIAVAAITMQLIEIGEHHPDVVERIRAVRVAGHLGNLQRGQFRVGLLQKLGRLLLETVDLFTDIH